MSSAAEPSHIRHHGGFEAFKTSLFQLVHCLAERGAKHRTTTLSQVVALATFLFDWSQFLSLLIRPQWGFHDDVVAVASTFNLRHQLFGRAWLRVQWVCLAVCLVVVGFFAYFNSVRRRLAAGSRDASLCRELQVLRAGISLLCTPCYTMVVDVVTAPLSCSEMQRTLGVGWQCFGGAHVAVCVACVLAIAVFVPHAVALKLLFHSSDPNAAEILAKSSGTGDALLASTTVLVALLSLVAYRLPSLTGLLVMLPLALLTGWTATHLPFYHQLLNPVSCLLHSSAVHLMIGAVISSASSGGETSFTVVWVCTMPISIGVGAWLPRLQWARISRTLSAVRPRMLQELRDHHKGSHREQRNLRANIEQLAARATSTRFRVARLPLSDVDDVEMPAPADTSNNSIMETLSSFEAELLVRCELSQPGNTDSRKRRRRFGRSTGSVPTTVAVEHSMWLYAEAMNAFAEDAVDIARVKIEYARFLQVYTGDVKLATGALEGALRERPSFEGEYQVFSRTRRLQEKRQSQATDADASMNQLAMVDYARRLRSALHTHEHALSDLQQLLRDIHRHKGTLLERADAMADKLGVRIASMAKNTARAHQQYRKLLVTHANGPGLHDVYRRFRRDVLHQRTADGDMSDFGSVASGASAKSAADVWGEVGYVPISTSDEVVKIDYRFRIGSLVLVLLGVGMAVCTALFVSQSDGDIEALRLAGDLRRQLVDAALAVREGALLASSGSDTAALRNETYSKMAVFKDSLYLVYDHTNAEDGSRVWDLNNRLANVYSTNDTWNSRTFNLWCLVNTALADTLQFLEQPQGYHDNKHWRFVMDNAVTRVLPALQELVDVLEQTAKERLHVFDIIQGCLFGVLVFVALFLGFGVFGRALTRVRDIKVGVVDIAANIPPLTISRMRRQVARGIAFVRRAVVKAEDVAMGEEDEETDRGMGPVDSFTYDADLEGDSAPTATRTPGGDRFQAAAALLMPRSGANPPAGLSTKKQAAAPLPTLAEVGSSSDFDSLSSLAAVHEEETKGVSPAGKRYRPAPPLREDLASSVSSSSVSLNAQPVSGFGMADNGVRKWTPPVVTSPAVTPTRQPGASRCPVAAHTVVARPGLRLRHPAATSATPSAARKAMPPGTPSIEAILLNVPGGIVCTDAIGTVLYSNKKAQDILGYTATELLGENVTILQPEALAARHHDIMERVTRGGEPEVIGKAGRQLKAIMKDKHEQPVLLALGRLDMDGRTYYVADIADISDDVGQAEENQQDDRVDRHKLVWAFVRVLLALVFVLLLQCGNFLFGVAGMASITTHAAEVVRASQLRSLSQSMAFACREAAIGDGEIWTAEESTRQLSADLALFSAIRFGLRFGDASLGLAGSVGVSESQDRLQFGDVQVNDELFQGLDAVMALYEHHADSCVRAFVDGTTSTGPNASALATHPVWTAMEDISMEPMRGMLALSEELYLELAHDEATQVLLVDQIITTFNCIVVIILYFVVFRTMVGDLLEQARWTEHMLSVVPSELGMSGPLKKYFRRRTAVDTKA